MDFRFNPLTVEIWRHRLASIAEEMGTTLERVAYSPNIRERLDYSCAIFDARGRLIAQAAHIPVHLGAMPLMMRKLLRAVSWSPNTLWLCNDPRFGGTHLPDLTLTAPVYTTNRTKRLIGFVSCRAHHADIGGMTPGSLPLSLSAYQEGLILPPVALVEKGKQREDLLDLLCANSRAPHERRGDIAAQIAACHVGISRMQQLVNRHGLTTFLHHAEETLHYAEAATRQILAQMPVGSWQAAQRLELPTDEVKYLKVTLRFDGSGTAQFDFSGTSAQTQSCLNATEAITHAACAYVVRCLASEELPTNEGCFAPLQIIAPEGTLVNARFPAATAGGNVETSQRLVALLLAALRQALPHQMPADSQGTMNNVVIGGLSTGEEDQEDAWTYYETLAGGAGASPQTPGASAVHTHMTNTRNTPVEVLESYYPLQVVEYALREGSGGRGFHPGGEGLIRRLRLRAPAHITLLTSSRAQRPQGANGGEAGASGRNYLLLPDGTEQELPAFWSGACPADTVLTVETPGGGGWGAPPG